MLNFYHYSKPLSKEYFARLIHMMQVLMILEKWKRQEIGTDMAIKRRVLWDRNFNGRKRMLPEILVDRSTTEGTKDSLVLSSHIHLPSADPTR